MSEINLKVLNWEGQKIALPAATLAVITRRSEDDMISVAVGRQIFLGDEIKIVADGAVLCCGEIPLLVLPIGSAIKTITKAIYK